MTDSAARFEAVENLRSALRFCRQADIPPAAPVEEYGFHPTRKWRFDYAFVGEKLAVEVEGGVWKRGCNGCAAACGRCSPCRFPTTFPASASSKKQGGRLMDSEWQACDRRCTCGDRNVVYRVVEDDEGHTDEQYRCRSCGRDWWIDGADC
jgi:hypothetical protein